MTGPITRDVLEGFLECKYKGWNRLARVEGEQSDYQAMVSGDDAKARGRAFTHLLSRHPTGENRRGAASTIDDLSMGVPLVLDATVTNGQASLRFDGLLRVEGASALGGFHYVPLICQAASPIRRQTRLLLAVMGLVLGAVQGRRPALAVVVRGPDCRRTKVQLSAKLSRRAGDLLEEIRQTLAGRKAPALTLNGHCPECEYRKRCHAEAVEKDDLSLLRGVSEAELRKHRGRGIFTVTQLSYTFRPRRKGKRAGEQGRPHDPALQALAIRDAKTYVLGKPEVPDRPARVYLDLEGAADASSAYLLGALVVKGGAEAMHSFWADDPAGEVALFRRLLALLEGEDFALFHFGSYEKKFLNRMRRSAARKGPVDRILANATDVLSLIRSNAYFPVYANGLKPIAQHLGFGW